MKKNETIEIDLGELFSILMSRALLIISAAIFFALASYGVSKYVMDATYKSTTEIYILNKEENSTVTYSDVQISTQLTQDYAQLIKSRYVLEEVIQRLNLDTTFEKLSKVVTVNTPDNTRIVSITVQDTDPLMAMKIANCVREVSSEHISSVMDIDAINVAETANVPTQPSGPETMKMTVLGGLGGAFLVAVFVVLEYLMDDTIKGSDDVEKYLGLSTLALIPLTETESDKKKKKK